MSRKSKRQSRKRSAPAGGAKSRTREIEFNPDYSQTIKDLKRIAILASTFFVILIILAVFLR